MIASIKCAAVESTSVGMLFKLTKVFLEILYNIISFILRDGACDIICYSVTFMPNLHQLR